MTDKIFISKIQKHLSVCSHQVSLSFTITLSLLKCVSIESVMPSNHLILCSTLILLSSIFLSIRVFNELAFHISSSKYWSFSFSIYPSKNIEGWFPLGLTSLIPLLSKGFSRVFFSTTWWKYQFFHSHTSVWSNSHIYKWLLKTKQT